jgi:outer membrane protein OmpA-like peptidoglycan-associated protein
MAPPEALASHSKRTIVMHRIDFEPNTFRITPEAAPVLDEAIQLLGGNSEPAAVVIDQWADADRSQTFRLFTTRQRAKAVRRYLVDHGIDPSRVSLPPVAAAILAGNRSAQSPRVELHVD